MTEEERKYLTEKIKKSLHILTPHNTLNYSKIRIGNKEKDGGYIMIDDFKDIRIAISGGIGTEDSWEREIVSNNISVEAFDTNPSNFDVPYRFFVTPLTTYHYGNTTLDMILSGYKNYEAIMKLDIDGAEWALFENTSLDTLNKIRQIVIEIHLQGNLLNLINHYPIFDKLSKLFKVVHVHGNNYGDRFLFENKMIPDVMELTFANKNYYTLVPSNETFPTHLDKPNCKSNLEIELGTFTFE